MPIDFYLFLAEGAGRNLSEAHPFGPDPQGGYRTAQEVDVDPAGARATAVCDGRIRSLDGGGTLVLQPDPAALEALGEALDLDGPLLFVYRNLAPTSVVARWQAVFAGGGEPIVVRAGGALGDADAGVTGRPRIAFEIVSVPRGLDIAADLPWRRVADLIDPAALTRRLDPTWCFATLAAATDGTARLAAGQAALLAGFARRTLIEIRDEWDLPFQGAVTLQRGAAAPATASAPPAARGTLVLSPEQADYTVSVDGCVLTVLPSDAASQRQLRETLAGPAHLALQALFMAAEPADDDEARSWFAPNTPPRRRFTENNRVTAIRDGIDVFHHYVDAIRTASAPGHHLYVAGWFLDDQFQLVPGDPATSFHALATAAATAGADVRALLWKATLFQNAAEVERIRALPNGRGGAVLDDDTLVVGSHHQKFMVVNGSQGAFAFAGGVDINPDRLDTPSHGAPGPFHDVQLKLEGPAVADIQRTFVDRWNAAKHPDRPPMPTETPPIPPTGRAFVQIACTFPPRRKYPFAPSGTLAPLEGVVRAIQKARRYIYLEDQYLTPYPGMDAFDPAHDTLGFTSALRDALARIDYLIMVVPNHTDQPQGRVMRAQFIRALTDVAPDKVHVFYLQRPADHPCRPDEVAVCKHGPRSGMSGNPNEIYCHSKTWIIDDVCARVGSANCNRRSYTHDSEMDVIVVDGAVDNGARAFARRLRLDLWSEILRVPDPTVLEDHLAALDYWVHPRPGAFIGRYDPSAELKPSLGERAGSWLEDIAAHLRLEPAQVAAAVAARAPGDRVPNGSASTVAAQARAAGGVAPEIAETAAALEYDPVLSWGLVDPDGR